MKWNYYDCFLSAKKNIPDFVIINWIDSHDFESLEYATIFSIIDQSIENLKNYAQKKND